MTTQPSHVNNQDPQPKDHFPSSHYRPSFPPVLLLILSQKSRRTAQALTRRRHLLRCRTRGCTTETLTHTLCTRRLSARTLTLSTRMVQVLVQVGVHRVGVGITAPPSDLHRHPQLCIIPSPHPPQTFTATTPSISTRTTCITQTPTSNNPRSLPPTPSTPTLIPAEEASEDPISPPRPFQPPPCHLTRGTLVLPTE